MRGTKEDPSRVLSHREIALTFPILPGMSDQVLHLATELSGPRAEDFRQSQRNLGVRKESWFLNTSPRGDSVTVYIEAANVNRLLRNLIASQTDVDLWLKTEVRRVTGIDFGGSFQVSLPKQILRYLA